MRFYPWFRATLTSWLITLAKNHTKKHLEEYRPFLAEIGPVANGLFLLTGMVLRLDGKEQAKYEERTGKHYNQISRKTCRSGIFDPIFFKNLRSIFDLFFKYLQKVLSKRGFLNQFGRPKKRSTKFWNIFENPPPRENPRSAAEPDINIFQIVESTVP